MYSNLSVLVVLLVPGVLVNPHFQESLHSREIQQHHPYHHGRLCLAVHDDIGDNGADRLCTSGFDVNPWFWLAQPQRICMPPEI